jgi:hypothetical protein
MEDQIRGFVCDAEAGRHNTGNRERPAIDDYSPADYGSVASESPLPVTVNV